MKRKIHKNQVVIATLAVLIAIAGYISYDKSGISDKPSDKEANADGVADGEDSSDWENLVWAEGNTEIVSGTEDELNPGESLLTGTIIDASNYAAAVKLNREQIRAKNQEALLEIINNEQLSEDVGADLGRSGQQLAPDSGNGICECTQLRLCILQSLLQF